jgi:hypothetical protein
MGDIVVLMARGQSARPGFLDVDSALIGRYGKRIASWRIGRFLAGS